MSLRPSIHIPPDAGRLGNFSRILQLGKGFFWKLAVNCAAVRNAYQAEPKTWIELINLYRQANLEHLQDQEAPGSVRFGSVSMSGSGSNGSVSKCSSDGSGSAGSKNSDPP